ncbi:LOW QUALITY PROTEIN: hypothetical protein CVT25_011801, partial [Psilocybe cyanescens]
HGVKYTRLTNEEREARKRREQSKIEEFTKLSTAALSKKREHDWSRDAFDLTTRLLQVNPEFYTIWNYRRDILTNGLFMNSIPETINDLLTDELAMTMSALKTHPKVYWIWNHRMWCLEHVPESLGQDSESASGWRQKAWDRELFVVEKMLDADPRNFLAWDYRRYVLASMPVPRPESAELVYTSRKIGANFSNFSAWHQRSKTLSSLWKQGKLNEEKSREEGTDRNNVAIFWLMLSKNLNYLETRCIRIQMTRAFGCTIVGYKELLHREITSIQELLDEQPDSKCRFYRRCPQVVVNDLRIGCMESIVHYNRLLLKKWTAGKDAVPLINDIRTLLHRLEELDPARRRRYQDLGAAPQSLVASTADTSGYCQAHELDQ